MLEFDPSDLPTRDGAAGCQFRVESSKALTAHQTDTAVVFAAVMPKCRVTGPVLSGLVSCHFADE